MRQPLALSTVMHFSPTWQLESLSQGPPKGWFTSATDAGSFGHGDGPHAQAAASAAQNSRVVMNSLLLCRPKRPPPDRIL
jgi:hypothetical protein